MSVFTPVTPASPSASPPRAAAARAASSPRLPRYWPTWAMLSVFIFMSFECVLLAAALKGAWFILIAPGLVCAIKAWDAWKTLRKAMD